VEGLASAVALGLELPLGQEDPVVQIGQALAGRGRCLLILDNFEHLARWAEPTLGRWLDRAPEAAFLVTTREVLGIAGEQTLALAPLQADDAEALFHQRAAAGEPQASASFTSASGCGSAGTRKPCTWRRIPRQRPGMRTCSSARQGVGSRRPRVQ
jgi:hypothetical protein